MRPSRNLGSTQLSNLMLGDIREVGRVAFCVGAASHTGWTNVAAARPSIAFRFALCRTWSPCFQRRTPIGLCRTLQKRVGCVDGAENRENVLEEPAAFREIDSHVLMKDFRNDCGR